MDRAKVLDYLHNTDLEDIKAEVKTIEEQITVYTAKAYEEKKAGNEDTFLAIADSLEELKAYYRMYRGYYDTLFFTYMYFSEEHNPDNETNLIPMGTRLEDAPEFHRELCGKLDELNVEKPTKNICWGAPRGTGKSAYLSNIEPIHSVCYGNRKYIMIISETASISANFIAFISTNLKTNKKLRDDFGDLLSPNKMKNEQDNSEGFITLTDIKVQASSMGGRLRGARHKNTRPDLIICDDLESAQNTNTEDLRQKNLHWFNSVVEPLGDITRTAIVYMGTLVHGQGLLPNIMNRSNYDSKLYSSIVSEPLHPDKWDKVDEMLRDIDNPNRLDEAYTLYLKNKDEMDEGIEVLWADRFSYFDLMVKKVEIGSRAFSSEYLNIPSDNESAIFTDNHFNYYTDNDLFDRFGKSVPLDIVGFYDIAMGKSNKSDFNSIHIIGRDRRTGAIYVLESWNKQCTPSTAITQVMHYIEKYRPRVFGVETINAQFEIYRQIQSMCIQRGYYFTKIKSVNPSTKKETRIEALEPLFEAGVIRTKKNMRLLHEMLIQFPNHSHDDAPDCLASAIELLRVNKKKGYYYKPEGL